ncbi:MAG TPA: circularly permuted type 2 ATP-grasp protein [Polyangiaceae bacterium]|nr:circularly permuted type 2 ATP-grasp protein [Polyangiaceae bacterium]
MDLTNYNPEEKHYFDELFSTTGQVRSGFEPLVNGIQELGSEVVLHRQAAAEQALLRAGITFTLRYDGDNSDTERIFPFDIIPRVVSAKEWETVDRGIRQRLTALNLFLSDVYGPQKILKDKVVPLSLIESCPDFRRPLLGMKPPRGIWCHISGTDLVRDQHGEFLVLEDNVRCPSGVSYVLENRQILKRTFPKIFERMSVRPVDDYPVRLLEMLRYLALERVDDPHVVVLTPGRYNSAYFEHAFLAQQMGVELVQSEDLIVKDDFVYMKTTAGFSRVDVIYRRVGDDYLDPEVFRPESLLGVPGLMRAYFKGNVALANAPGTGVADDKAIYAYVERIIRYYLDEEPILKNVPTYICSEDEARAYVLDHLDELVVKATDGAGGYGMLIGPHSTAAEREDFAQRVKNNPRGYIAQPTLALSRVPTIIDRQAEPRHVDLRPYALHGEKIYVQPGGLTRVALRKGSLVVNSSQGGGSKDTWVLAE